MTTASISRPVQLGLTVILTALCSAFFLAVYVQLWLLLRYTQERLSYQSALLFLGLLWASCRTVLFCFYLTDSAWAREIGTFPHWLLYCAPLCLQFISLCLLSLYFSQVIYKARCSTDFTSRKIPQYICFLSLTLVFLVVNLSCILIRGRTDDLHGWLTLARVIVSDCLFATCSISLANNTYKIATTAPVYVYLESKGSSGRTTVVTGSLICILYISRGLYNLVMVSLQWHSKPTPFSYGWNGVSDHIVTEEVNGMEYLIFGIILVLCEFIPMCIIAHYFRAKKPVQNLEAAGMVNSQSFGSRAYFFDNPRRYDSDDDLTRLASTRGERGGSLSSTPKTSVCYGAVGSTSGCALAPPLLEPSTGTPVLFTCGGNLTS